MSLRPLNDRVFVRPDEPEKKIGNIHLPDEAHQSTLRGTVVAVGPGRLNDNGLPIPMQVKVGDVVFYSWGGSECFDGTEKLLAFKESEIMAIVEES